MGRPVKFPRYGMANGMQELVINLTMNGASAPTLSTNIETARAATAAARSALGVYTVTLKHTWRSLEGWSFCPKIASADTRNVQLTSETVSTTKIITFTALDETNTADDIAANDLLSIILKLRDMARG